MATFGAASSNLNPNRSAEVIGVSSFLFTNYFEQMFFLPKLFIVLIELRLVFDLLGFSERWRHLRLIQFRAFVLVPRPIIWSLRRGIIRYIHVPCVWYFFSLYMRVSV